MNLLKRQNQDWKHRFLHYQFYRFGLGMTLLGSPRFLVGPGGPRVLTAHGLICSGSSGPFPAVYYTNKNSSYLWSSRANILIWIPPVAPLMFHFGCQKLKGWGRTFQDFSEGSYSSEDTGQRQSCAAHWSQGGPPGGHKNILLASTVAAVQLSKL